MKNPFAKFEYYPLRIKLTAWFTLSFIAVMAFSFISFYVVTRSMLLSKIDNSLKSQATEIANLLKDQTISPASKELILRSFQITKTSFVLILDSQNEVVVQSQSFPVDEHLLANLTQLLQTSPQPQLTTQEKTRFYIYPLINDNSFFGTVIVGDSISAIDETFAVLLNTLLLIFLLFLLPLILMSFLEADISLSPLRELANKMNSITTKNLSDRVDILNPKDEIGEVSTAFNKLLDRLQKGFDKERQLIHDVSHQLKTPLTAMRSDIEISLSKKRNNSDYQLILKNILSDTVRMTDLLKDMLNFAWAATENQEHSFTRLNLSAILEELSEIATQLGMEKNITVKTSILPDINVHGQREKLYQIFMNILENAIKYSFANGIIFIQASVGTTTAKIIIKDIGIGIRRKDLPHIFERFYRGNSVIDEGSGLGLSITAALVKAHKGTIEVASQWHKGTTMIINLPLVKQPQGIKPNGKLKDQKTKTTTGFPSYRTIFFNRIISHQSKENVQMKKSS